MLNIDKKSVFVAIVGKSNVGKSSLINRLVGEKIAIVSHRPQTTRNRITGILTKGTYQYVFLDTPGLFKSKDKLGHKMVKTVKNSTNDVDLIVMVVEPSEKIAMAEKDFIETFKKINIPVILVINKVDLIKNDNELIKIKKLYNDAYNFESIIPVSTISGDGIDDLMSNVKNHAIESEHFFPADMITDKSERFIASEILREKLLINMRDEIPHGTAVLVEEMKRVKNLFHIYCVIYCNKESHKGIIIGKNGAMLKNVATQARVEMEDFFNCKVDLKCWVKVKSDWKNQEYLLKSLGFMVDM